MNFFFLQELDQEEARQEERKSELFAHSIILCVSSFDSLVGTYFCTHFHHFIVVTSSHLLAEC